MSAIQIKLSLTEDDLFCKSKWWGNPDISNDFHFDDTLMFLCQIRCVDEDDDYNLMFMDKECYM